MNSIRTAIAVASAIVVGLVGAYAIVRWIGRFRTLRAADRIARAFATEQALARASRELRSKLESYRLAKVRANLGASSTLHAAAMELVREHRLYALERR